jgi:hypothetical protein
MKYIATGARWGKEVEGKKTEYGGAFSIGQLLADIVDAYCLRDVSLLFRRIKKAEKYFDRIVARNDLTSSRTLQHIITAFRGKQYQELHELIKNARQIYARRKIHYPVTDTPQAIKTGAIVHKDAKVENVYINKFQRVKNKARRIRNENKANIEL